MPASDNMKIIMQNDKSGARRLNPAKSDNRASPAFSSTTETTPKAPSTVSAYVTT